MHPTILNRRQSRCVDEIAINDFKIPGIVLMENAGRGCAEILLNSRCGPTVICCGSGNNGGDGFVIARHLSIHSIATKILLFCDPQKLTGDALTNFQIVRQMDLPLVIAPGEFDRRWIEDQLAEVNQKPTDWIVDALLGTGAAGPVRAPYELVARAMNDTDARRMAIDIPTGVDCDTGAVENVAIRADVTCTFVTAKPGLIVESSKEFVGEMKIIDIGIPTRIIELAREQI